MYKCSLGFPIIMKIFVLLAVLAMQFVATKSWNGDNYSEDSFCLFGWIGYLKRLSLILLMLSGVVLYYVPESRPHARRACYIIIDFAANGLKSALNINENDYVYEEIKSKYHRARYDQSSAMQKPLSQEIFDNDVDYGNSRENRGKTKCTPEEDGSPRVLVKKNKSKHSKEEKRERNHRQSGHRLRSSIVKNTSEPCMEIVKPRYFYSDKLEELQKYLNSSLCDLKRLNGATVENYAFLISGSPRQMSIIDRKFDDDLVILQDPRQRIEYKECSTSTNKLSSKSQDGSYSAQEGPTKDRSNCNTSMGKRADPGKQNKVNFTRPMDSPECSEYEMIYQKNRYKDQAECCSNDYPEYMVDFVENNEHVNTVPVDRSTQNLTNTTRHKKMEQVSENSHVDHCKKYDGENRYLSKSRVSVNERKSNFEMGSQKPCTQTKIKQKQNEVTRSYESTLKNNSRKVKLRNDSPRKYCCTDSHFTDRGEEADDENSYRKRGNSKLDLDVKPHREHCMFHKNSDDSLYFDYDYGCNYEHYHTKCRKNGMKPALLKAVNWIFGGCPEASRKAGVKPAEVEKEEIQTDTNEWLH